MRESRSSPAQSNFLRTDGCLVMLASLVTTVAAAIVAAIVVWMWEDSRVEHDPEPAELRTIENCIAVYKAMMRPPDEPLATTDDDVRRGEVALGAELPEDFVVFAVGISGFTGMPDQFRGFLGTRTPHLDIALLRPSDLKWTGFDPSLIAFYDTGYGDSVCFKVVEGQCIDRIYRFRHDDPDDRVTEEAPNFRAWLSGYIDRLESERFRWNGTEWVEPP